MKPLRYVVDRLEDDGWAVLEDEQGRVFDCPLAWLPPGTEAGDVLLSLTLKAGERSVLYLKRDDAAKEARLAEARARLRRLRRRDPGGDIEL